MSQPHSAMNQQHCYRRTSASSAPVSHFCSSTAARLAAVLLLACCCAAGCGAGGPRTAAVTGTVTYKGKPVPQANVSFVPTDASGRAATGLTDASGRFTLGTFAASDGALPGAYRIGIIARGPDRAPKPGESGSGMPGEKMPGEALIPAKYFAPDTSGLTSEVKPGKNSVLLDLKD